MSPDQDRWRRLVAFDGHAGAFIAHGRQTVDLGEVMAEAEIGRLWALAGRVARDLADWREEIGHLDLARAAPVTPRRAASLISEGFFDDALTPLAHAVFDKALDLAVDARPETPPRPSCRPA
jgi:hypothetical protein